MLRTPDRLNPFAFPSDTDFRLLLLVAAIVGAGLFIYDWIYIGLPQTRGDIKVLTACSTSSQAAKPTDPFARNEAFERCRAPIERSTGVFMVGGIAVMLAGAAGIYLLLPLLKLRRGRLEALAEEDAPEVLTVLRELCREAELKAVPKFVWNPLNSTVCALAFGRLGRHYVALSGGMVSRLYSDPGAFKAILLHELAHLRNADVDKAYFAVALWWAFVALAAVPLAATIVTQPTIAAAGSVLSLVGWRLAALTAIVFLIRNAVLRAREAYADLRASSWDGPQSALPRVLTELRGGARGRLRLLVNSLSAHPDPEARRALIGDTRSLFRIGIWEAFGTGLAAALAFPTLVDLQLMFLTGYAPKAFYLTSGQIANLVAGLLVGSLSATIVGLGVWRGELVELLEQRRSLHLGRLALALTAGLVIGQWLALTSGFDTGSRTSIVVAGVYLAWVAILLLGCWLLLAWTRSVGQAWLGVALSRGIGRPSYLPALITLSALFSAWLGVLFFVRDVGSVATGVGDTGVLLALFLGAGVAFQFLVNPVSLLALASLWAIPFASWLQGRRRSALDWAYMDRSGPHPHGEDIPLPLRPTAKMALAGAGVFLVLDALIHVFVRFALPAIQSDQTDFKLMYFVVQVLVAVLIQGCVGAGAATRPGPLPVIRGLFGAFITGTLMTVAILGINLIFGGTISFSFLLLTVGVVVNLGAALALPLTAVLLAFRRSKGEVPWLQPSIQS
jgi:Zn-dependent protease with chaperone function